MCQCMFMFKSSCTNHVRCLFRKSISARFNSPVSPFGSQASFSSSCTELLSPPSIAFPHVTTVPSERRRAKARADDTSCAWRTWAVKVAPFWMCEDRKVDLLCKMTPARWLFQPFNPGTIRQKWKKAHNIAPMTSQYIYIHIYVYKYIYMHNI